jgi:glycosyltransferase involved in cell wall biosynthesis
MKKMIKQKILAFAPRIASISETFIYDQITGIDAFEVLPVCNERLNYNLYKFVHEPIVLGTRPVRMHDRILSKIQRIISNDNKYSLHFTAKKQLKKLIISNNARLIHCHYGLSAVSLITLIAKLKVPLVVTFHGFDASRMLRDNNYVAKLKELFELNVYTITVSKEMESRLVEYGMNPIRNKIIPCGIDTDYFQKNNNKIESNPLILLHSGRVTPKKGVLDLAITFKEILENTCNIVLWVVGDGTGYDDDEYDRLKHFVVQNKLNEKIILWGAQPKEKVKELMQKADIFILNSRISNDGDMEGLPVSILEAMACGLPVVSTYHSGIP